MMVIILPIAIMISSVAGQIPPNSFRCTTCFDPGYFEHAPVKGNALFYNNPKLPFCPARAHESKRINLARHYCQSSCVFGIQMADTVSTVEGFNVTRAILCVDLLHDFIPPMHDDGCVMFKLENKKGYSEVLCWCSKPECNLHIANFVEDIVDDFKAKKKNGSLILDIWEAWQNKDLMQAAEDRYERPLSTPMMTSTVVHTTTSTTTTTPSTTTETTTTTFTTTTTTTITTTTTTTMTTTMITTLTTSTTTITEATTQKTALLSSAKPEDLYTLKHDNETEIFAAASDASNWILMIVIFCVIIIFLLVGSLTAYKCYKAKLEKEKKDTEAQPVVFTSENRISLPLRIFLPPPDMDLAGSDNDNFDDYEPQGMRCDPFPDNMSMEDQNEYTEQYQANDVITRKPN